MGKYKGNMKRVGTKIPGADDMLSPPKGQKGYDRLAASETTFYDGQLRPGPRLMRPARRGKRISRDRTANDAAMALSQAMLKKRDARSSGAGYSGKGEKEFFKSVGFKA